MPEGQESGRGLSRGGHRLSGGRRFFPGAGGHDQRGSKQGKDEQGKRDTSPRLHGTATSSSGWPRPRRGDARV